MKQTAPSSSLLFDSNPRDRAACGIGVTANMDGSREHSLVEDAARRLACMDSRGGTHVEHNTGDGAGIRTQIPTKLFQRHVAKDVMLEDGKFGVAQLFLPKGEVPAQEDGLTHSQRIVKEEIERSGLRFLGWRDVPFNGADISAVAQEKLPVLKQAIFDFPGIDDPAQREQMAIRARTAIEQRAQAERSTLYIPSMSSESIVYKGMFRASEIPEVYLDLKNPEYETAWAEVHNRMSTNTNPDHTRAQPCRKVSINGEMNTIAKNEQDRLIHDREVLQGHNSFVPGISDSLRFDADVETYVAQGYSLSEAITLLMPPMVQDGDKSLSPDAKAMLEWFQRQRSSYNGPSHVVFAGSGEVGAKLDSSGLRPSRGVVTEEGGKRRLHLYSEDMVDLAPEHVVERFSLRPGEMVRMKDGEIMRSHQILEAMAAKHPSGHYQALLAQHSVALPEEPTLPMPTVYTLPLRKRQEAAFWDQEILEKMIEPMAVKGEQEVIAMGDDTPLSVLTEHPRHIATFAKQRFAQVTAPSMDAIRERESFSLRVRLGANPAARADTRQLTIESPILRAGELEQIEAAQTAGFYVAKLDMTFPVEQEEVGMRTAITQLCQKAEEAVRAGNTVLVLSDKKVSGVRASIPDVIAVAAVHQHLIDKGLRLQASLVAESAQTCSPHHASTVLAFGASAVSPYLAYETIAQDVAPRKGLDPQEACDQFHEAMSKSHLKTMAKMGITQAENYNMGAMMELLGLQTEQDGPLPPVAEAPSLANIFRGVPSPIGGFSLRDVATSVLVRHQLSMHQQFVHERELPDYGTYANRLGGVAHSYGPDAVEIFSDWLGEEAVAETHRGAEPYPVADIAEPKSPGGRYREPYIDGFAVTDPYRKFSRRIEELRETAPVSLSDGLRVRGREVLDFTKAQSAEDMVALFQKAQALGNTPRLHGLTIEPSGEAGGYMLTLQPVHGEQMEETALRYQHLEQALEMMYAQHMQRTALNGRFLLGAEPESVLDRLFASLHANQAHLRAPIPLEAVQPATDILGHNASGGMSYGALTQGAWETVARAENAVRSRSNAGEGGELPENLGTLANAKHKQIASGRFGITPQMLAAIPKDGLLEIKVSQGAKPGEGGQLPGEKVSIDIAALRGSMPGVPLTSPAPHHDIYSIEDLKELIHDLKAAGVRVGVKLAASDGIGTIACGVVKAGADEINIAGNSGGTGAAMATSVKNTGIPAELGLSMVDQSLRESGLRDLVSLRTSGAFKNGMDIVKAAILGADDFEWGTSELMVVGCKMLRLCNKPGGCAPGITNSGHAFRGQAKDIERFKLNVAAEVREILAGLGYSSLDEIRGHTELLDMRVPEHLQGKLSFDRMFYRPPNVPVSEEAIARHRAPKPRQDAEIAESLQGVHFADGRMELPTRHLTTEDRAFGAALSVAVCNTLRRPQKQEVASALVDRPFGSDLSASTCNTPHAARVTRSYVSRQPASPLQEGQCWAEEDHITVPTRGNAGQSFGFVNAHGVYLHHTGPVQDGAGKSMAGGVIAIATPKRAGYDAHENVIAGNAAFFGASGGKAFVNGQAGDRFGVLLKGATVVVEGVGDYGGEYMTSGTMLNLGKVGKHFGAGASGGLAFHYDPPSAVASVERFEDKMDAAVRIATPAETAQYHDVIKGLLQEHYKRTGSERAAHILHHWEVEKGHFRMTVPCALDKVRTSDVEKTFAQRTVPPSDAESRWVLQTQQQGRAIDQQPVATMAW